VTTGQRWVVIIAGLAAILMLLFPPWETFGGHYLAHSAIISPPRPSDYRPATERWALPAPEPLGRVSARLLAVEWAVLAVCAAAAFMLLAAPREDRDDKR
jgi:hypothetical protein